MLFVYWVEKMIVVHRPAFTENFKDRGRIKICFQCKLVEYEAGEEAMKSRYTLLLRGKKYLLITKAKEGKWNRGVYSLVN